MLDNLSDEQKSVMLAKAMGWEKDTYHRVWVDNTAEEVHRTSSFNLYDPANMALAWRVLNWCHEEMYSNQWLEFSNWWNGYYSTPDSLHFWGLSPADAQRLWLDKILELAIEAGLAEVDDVE